MNSMNYIKNEITRLESGISIGKEMIASLGEDAWRSERMPMYDLIGQYKIRIAQLKWVLKNYGKR